MHLFFRDRPPLYGSIYSFNSDTLAFKFYANFSYHIDDKETDLYFFENGPVAVTNNSQSTIYFPIQCGTSFQRLLLVAFNMKKKTYQQSSWILHDGVFHCLHYDPYRERLFGIRDRSTFTLIMEEYNLSTLDVSRNYTQQDGETYAFVYAWCSIFDYEENWVVQVRTRFENPSVEAYFVKMDLNLVGKKDDIVVEFRHLPNIHNLCTMTYDIRSKTALVTWQHGSIDQNLVMMYMNPYTSEFSNETLLFKMTSGYVIESVEAVYNSLTDEVLFLIDKQSENDQPDEQWMIVVEFHTMNILNKKQVKTVSGIDMWQFFLL